MLPDDTQEVLRPHFNSTYVCVLWLSCNHDRAFCVSSRYTASVPKLGKYKVPIFGSSKSMSFHEWIQRWCAALVHKVNLFHKPYDSC